jgi:hypothetical protein
MEYIEEIVLKEYSGIIVFFVKSLIVFILFILVVLILFPNMKEIHERWDNFLSKRENKALVLSFIQNPVALRISAEHDFDRKNFADAALKYELAIGLFEMNGASPATIGPYQARLMEATKLVEQPK